MTATTKEKRKANNGAKIKRTREPGARGLAGSRGRALGGCRAEPAGSGQSPVKVQRQELYAFP